nr:tyrosine-type recombinase/integrase [Isorropodon fossajaponicum symbiont]
MLKWLEVSKIENSYLFQSLFKGGRLRGNKMHHSDIPRIVKHYSSLIGLDSSNISGHFLRAGFVTSAVAHGARLDKIMETTRHKSPQTVLYYMRDKDLFDDHAGVGFL